MSFPTLLPLPFRVLLAIQLLAGAASLILADETPKFRTDDSQDASVPWFQLAPGQFPPAGSGHAISGELIWTDHVERRFRIRVDRDDSQQAGNLDLPLEAAMLPYGSIYYAAAPAALQDIPLTTHLHGSFYQKEAEDDAPPPEGWYGRTTKDVDFRRCMRLEDDFSIYARQRQIWKVDAVDLAQRSLTATLHAEGKPIGEPHKFDLVEATRVYQADRLGTLESIEAGQEVLFNLTWSTLYGPGRIKEIWLDQQSRDLATQHQLRQHRQYTRDRGLAGWIDAVDDEKRIVTITFFDGVDEALFQELDDIDEAPHGWPFSYPEDDPKAPKGGICVARDCLMTYDPVNDRKGGNIVKFGQVPKQPGSSGVQIDVKCGMLLEGFRPQRIVRFYPATWDVVALPREEQYHGRE